ncbi:MAG: L-histidine N(alpha)-methyltransferase [Candidatus Saccharimonadales bacterium]
MDITNNQQYELLAAISARGEVPTKFIYLDGGEKFWDAVYGQRSEDNGIANEEISLLLSHMTSFAGVFDGAKGINLIDLGCGNGIPAIAIINQLQDRGFQVNYVAVDISTAMMDLAESNILSQFRDLNINKLLLDFEKQSLADELINVKQSNDFPNLLVDLGNTLGNHVNVTSVLTNFLESMTLDDYLLIGNGLANEYNPQKILASYTDEVKALVTHPVKLLGIYTDTDEFKFIWNENKNRVEGRIRLNNPRKIMLANQEINLSSGEELLVMQSNKYSESSLTKMLSDVGFRTELLTTTKNRDEIVVMVQPTRYSA